MLLPFRSPSLLLAAVKWSKKLIWVLWVLSGIVYVSFPGNQTEDGVFIYDSNAHALMFLPFGVINSCAPVCVPRKTEENNGSVLGLWILTFEWVHLRTFSREPNKADTARLILVFFVPYLVWDTEVSVWLTRNWRKNMGLFSFSGQVFFTPTFSRNKQSLIAGLLVPICLASYLFQFQYL